MRIYKTEEVLNNLKKAIEFREPFSLIRFGDGGIKLIHAYFYNDRDQLDQIVEKEGIPCDKIKSLIDLWAISASNANFIDTPQVYFSSKFWPRVKGQKNISEKTIQRLKMWDKLYKIANFEIKNFCNPEVNFLSCLNFFRYNGFPDLIINKKVCIITSREDIKRILVHYNADIDVVNIPGFTMNQYRVFSDVLDKIKSDARKYDLWLVAAGELGRVYSGIIKFNGGRAFDIGSTVDYWVTKRIPDRLKLFIEQDDNFNLKVKLTEKGSLYRQHI